MLELSGFVQLEVTSRCNLACQACPRGAPGIRLTERDLPRELFERAVEATIRPGQRYHLQGWGEPLLRPDFPELARSIAERGGVASVTTRATAITPDLARDLVETGLEFITLSVACDRDLESALESLRNLRRVRKKARRRKPVLAASFLMRRSVIGSLDGAVTKLKQAGLERLIAVHPILTLTAEQESDLIFDPITGRVDDTAVEALRRGVLAAMWRSLPFDFDPIEADTGSVCREDPSGSLFVGASGDIYPCAYLGLPVEGAYTVRYRGREAVRQRTSMGNLGRGTLREIWHSPAYVDFRETFSTSGSSLPQSCRSCLRALGY